MSAYAPLRRKSDDANPTKLWRKPASRVVRRAITRVASHGRPANDSEAKTLSGVTQRLDTALSSGGEPLSPRVLRFMEPRLGARFDDVRVHHDARADALSRALNARAFTLGSDVFFERGQFEPDTPRGQRLLSHELAHVVQQQRMPADTPAPVMRKVGECGEVGLCTRDWESFPTLYHSGGKTEFSCRPAVGQAQHLLNEYHDKYYRKCLNDMYTPSDPQLYLENPHKETRMGLFKDWPSVDEDCWFGTNTEKAVKGFQAAVFEDPKEWDGIIGPKTWDALREFERRKECFLVSKRVTTHEAEKLSPRKVSIHVKNYAGSRGFQGNDWLTANRIFAQANVRVDIASIQSLDALRTADVVGPDLQLDHGRTDTRTAEERQLLATHDHSGAIEAHYVSMTQAGDEGMSYQDPGEPLTAVVAGGSTSTLAHELGHLLTGEPLHHLDRDNFMANAGGNGKNLMDDKQIAQIRSNPQVR